MASIHSSGDQSSLGARPAKKPLRVCPQSWLPRGVTRAALVRSLAPLLELPVEIVVPLHGSPITDNAHGVLTNALADALV